MASDWVSPTEDNGLAVPRDTLHVALIAPDRETASLWRKQARVIRPPLWKGGTVKLHVITQDNDANPDVAVCLALIDLGFLDAVDVGLVGYPSGLRSDCE